MTMSILKKYSDSGTDGTFRPQLTSLIDVMTILLVFLIKSFSVEGTLITPSDDLVLPVSNADKQPRQQCSIELTKTTILSDGQTIAGINDVDQNDSLLITPLFKWMSVQGKQCGDSTRGKEIMIQCDRELPYLYVKRVMYSCSKAGFNRFSVLVIQEEQ
jgi:biopolymer transport protein ExbD